MIFPEIEKYRVSAAAEGVVPALGDEFERIILVGIHA